MYVGNVTTPTMLMTGELDLRTPMPQTEEYYSALKMRGVPTVLLRFNGEYHGTGSQAVQLHADAAVHDELVPEACRRRGQGPSEPVRRGAHGFRVSPALVRSASIASRT